MSKNKTTTTTSDQTGTATSQGTAQTQDNASALWNLGLNAANSPAPVYNGQLTAGLSPDQQAAFGLISGAGSAGQSQLAAGSAAATNAAGYTPQTISGVPSVTAGSVSPAAGAVTAGQASTSALPGVDLSQYLNPYTQDVINTSLQGVEQSRQGAQQQLAGQQAASGAFGDARSGVQSALTNQLYDQNASSLVAQLNNQNYTQATGNAETDLARAAGVSQSNAANTTSANTATANNATSAGTTNANLGLQASMANASNALTAQGQNAANGLAANGQQLAAASTLGNLGMQSQSQVLNQANAQAAAGAVEQGTQQAGLTASYQDWLRQQGWSDQQIQQLSGIFNSTAPATGTTTTTQQNGTQQSVTPQSVIPSLLGAALQFIPGGGIAAQLGGAALSGGLDGSGAGQDTSGESYG